MKLHEGLRLDPAQVRKRERAAQCIETMRNTLTTLEYFIGNADAETLKGDWWADVVQDAENALRRALHVTTHDGQSRMGYGDGKG